MDKQLLQTRRFKPQNAALPMNYKPQNLGQQSSESALKIFV